MNRFLKNNLNQVQAIQPLGIKEGEQLGVDTIEEILVDAITLGEVIAAAIKGQPITSLLLFTAGIAAKYQNFGQVFGQAIAEFKDLDEAEAAQVMETVKREFDLENDALELAIENLLDLPLMGYRETIDSFEQIRLVASILKDKDTTLGAKLKALAENLDDLVNQGADVVEFFGKVLDAFRTLFNMWDKDQEELKA